MSAEAVPSGDGYSGLDVVRAVLLALAQRGITPEVGPSSVPKAVEAAGRLLRFLGVEDGTDQLADVIDLAAARARKAVV